MHCAPKPTLERTITLKKTLSKEVKSEAYVSYQSYDTW